MTEAHIKEQISRSYVNVLAARVGMTISIASQDYGFDGTFRDIEYDTVAKEYGETGFGIDYQLKATVNAKEKDVDNEKYAFRCFLLRLGFIGDEFKTERKILLRNLSGSSAFKSGKPNEQEVYE